MKKFNWINYYFNIEPATLITKDLLKHYIHQFWKNVVNKLEDNHHVIVLARVKYTNGQVATIDTLQKLNKKDDKYFLERLLTKLELKDDSYISHPIERMIFSYGIREGLSPEKGIITDVNYQTFNKYKLPITFNPIKYGKIIKVVNNQYIIQISETNLAIIDHEPNNINKIELFKKGELCLEWTDRYINENTFIREIGQKEFTFVNGELKLLTIKKDNKFITPIKKHKQINNKILTMDIETRVINNDHHPYCISIYDGLITKSFFITNYINIEEMMVDSLKFVCQWKYDNHKVYLHNFAKFDSIFLFKVMIKIGTINPIIHKGKFISIQFRYNNYVLEFRDSYLLLPSSLRKLGQSFNVDMKKGLFPHLFVNDPSISLDYDGLIPSISNFIDVSIDDYIHYMKDFLLNNKSWNLKSEAIHYCELDCISLYEILVKFNHIIFDKWNLNINSYPTLPSLSFAIFRAHYLKENTIVDITGKIYEDIKKSYTGGAVDMYIPQNESHEKVYGYDVNSLYPSQMKDKLMPVSDIVYFEGDIRKYEPNSFGYFYCKIKTPDNLEHPILQSHHKTKDGIRTIAALGEYEDMIFSMEMDNAMKIGYNIEI